MTDEQIQQFPAQTTVQNEETHLISIPQAVSRAVRIVKVNPLLFMGLFIIFVGAYVFVFILFSNLLKFTPVEVMINSLISYLGGGLVGLLLTLLSMVVSQLIFTFLLGSLIWLVVKSNIGEKTTFKEIFKIGAQKYFKLLLTFILQSFVVVVGLVLLIIPGIIFAILLFPMNFLVIEKDFNAWDALFESIRLIKRNFLGVLLLWLPLMIFYVLYLFILFDPITKTVLIGVLPIVHTTYLFVAYKSLQELQSDI